VIPIESEVTVPGATSLPPLASWILSALVLTAAIFDLRLRRIPNWLTGAGLMLGLTASIFERGIWRGLGFSLAGLCLALAIYLLLFALHATGAGDGKLMAAIGAMAGWKHWLGIFIVTAILGGIAALALSIWRRRLKKTLWNVGFVLSEMRRGRPAYLSNQELDVRSSKGLGLPHGAVIAAATLAYLTLGRYWGR
jgi:prepilin peptidase CpaA